jgi:hypothetical protein
MPTYRYYYLDSRGHLYGAEWFDADSDEEALAAVQGRHPDSHCEVWKGNSLIGSTSPDQDQLRA